MKFFIVLFLLNTFLFSKECYFNKVNQICYYRYFDKMSIYQAKADETYYINKKGEIYTFDNLMEVKFNSIGAFFTLRNMFELEFIDKIKKETYLFKVEDKRDLFSILTKLNSLKTVMKAQAHKKRKYTKEYIKKQQDAKKERLESVLKKSKKSKRDTTNGSKSFLKGNVQ
ncbi:MAG: hypothetical protein CSA86_03690 [Arcobacter sp.]|nr:MAG: hypothetical protein CSA86_03690 [Arcobacter sp.]